MPTLFIFLLKVNIALIVFCLGYYMVLRRLTFYTLNRAYLVSAIIFSSVYPLINISAFIERYQQLFNPAQKVIMLEAPVTTFINQPVYWHWAELLFWAGVILFAVRLFIQLLSLYKLYRSSKPGQIATHSVRIVNADISPFSFWQSIYINPTNLATADLESILQHEQIHVKEWHTLDILLSEISIIFYWFNPGVWLMKKAVSENIEFITDNKILQNGVDSKAYQYSLLNVSVTSKSPVRITNNFNFSILKKRIKMMNAKRSSNINLTRYILLVPAVVVLLLIFSFSKSAPVKKIRLDFRSATINTINKALATVPQTLKHVTVKKAHQAVITLPPARNVFISDDAPTVQPKENVVTNVDLTQPADKVKDILKQLPGIQIDNDGNISAQNKPITKIRINGKEYTSDEVQKAQANKIIKIQIIDKDQSHIKSDEDLINRMNNSLPANKTITGILINRQTIDPKRIEIGIKNANNGQDGASFSGKATGTINFIMKTVPVNLPVRKI